MVEPDETKMLMKTCDQPPTSSDDECVCVSNFYFSSTPASKQINFHNVHPTFLKKDQLVLNQKYI